MILSSSNRLEHVLIIKQVQSTYATKYGQMSLNPFSQANFESLLKLVMMTVRGAIHTPDYINTFVVLYDGIPSGYWQVVTKPGTLIPLVRCEKLDIIFWLCAIVQHSYCPSSVRKTPFCRKLSIEVTPNLWVKTTCPPYLQTIFFSKFKT